MLMEKSMRIQTSSSQICLPPQQRHIYTHWQWVGVGERRKRKEERDLINEGIIISYIWVGLGIWETISHLTFSKLLPFFMIVMQCFYNKKKIISHIDTSGLLTSELYFLKRETNTSLLNYSGKKRKGSQGLESNEQNLLLSLALG